MNKFFDNMLFFMVRQTWFNAGLDRTRMALFYALLFAANVIISLQPVVLAQLINTAQKGGPNSVHDSLLWAAAYGSLTLAFWLFHGPARVIERRLAFGVYRNFVAGLYRKVTEMPLRWHQDHHSGSTINRVNKAGRALFSFAQGQFVLIQLFIRFFVSLIALLWFSWWVATVSILATIGIMLIVRRYDKTLIPLIKRTNEREHHLSAALYDYIGNIITVLTLRLQSNTGTEINERFDAMKPSLWREIVINEWKWGTASSLLNVTQMVITGAYIGYHLWRNEPLLMGSVVAIFQYLLMINQLFFQGMMNYEQLMYQSTDMYGVDGLIEDHARLAGAKPPITPRPWREIVIQGLMFTHQEGEDVLHHLRDVNLTIKAGQKVALIGHSGSGKTTLLTLLRGLYEAQHVQLSIDGDGFESLAPLSGFTTLIPQDSEIFENTVHYNLTLGTDVPEHIVEQALAITTFDEVIPKLPEGVYTDIRERGVNLSGGQKQRLALARGLVAARSSSLLLLDEPTSSVDLSTETVLFNRLFAAFPDKTIIASIHRLHLLPRFDHIVFMQNGAIVEQGGFLDLLAIRGPFYHLWQHHLAQSAVGNEKENSEAVKIA